MGGECKEFSSAGAVAGAVAGGDDKRILYGKMVVGQPYVYDGTLVRYGTNTLVRGLGLRKAILRGGEGGGGGDLEKGGGDGGGDGRAEEGKERKKEGEKKEGKRREEKRREEKRREEERES